MQVEVNVEAPCRRSPAGLSSSEVAGPELAIAAETWNLWFQRWLEVLQPHLSPSQSYELSLRLTHDAEIQALNAQYRQQDRPTDVLAFAALEVAAPEAAEAGAYPLYLGDIVISVDTAAQQALEQQKSLEQEVIWLAAHGLLHLLGWDHPDPERLRQMLHQQDLLLQALESHPFSV